MRRRDAIAAPLWFGSGLASAAAPVAPSTTSKQLKTLRYAFPIAETGFDPVIVSDLYSRTVLAHVFEALYRFDYLARPAVVVPYTAEAMPETADDFRTWTIRIRPGTYFVDDPAFKGKPRELVAEDYVYTWKRFFDPAIRTPSYSLFSEIGALGVEALRDQATQSKKPFDYDRPVDGVRAIDRYTIQFRFENPRPRFLYTLASSSQYGAVAREAVEFYGEHIGEHPVGTGPFRLAEWRRSSRIVLERNPAYREVLYDGQPAADDVEGQALLRRFKARRLPMIDRVEISIIEESQPRWLSFLDGSLELILLPLEFSEQAIPSGRLAPYLAKLGVQMDRFANPDRTLYYFNMEDPVVGGMAPEKVALRRAIALGTDIDKEIRGPRRHQAIVAQSVVAPGGYGYDPGYRSENGVCDPGRAKALLDLYGYVDRDGDGWRELPDGSPLVVEYATTGDSSQRQFDEVWKKDMDAIGIRVRLKIAQWPEHLKSAQAGKLQLWRLAYTSGSPDFQDALEQLYGPSSGGQNLARFKEPRFDALYRKAQRLPDGPERLAVLHEADDITVAYMPQKYLVHRIVTYLAQPWLIGYRSPLYGSQFWQSVDIDPDAQAAKSAPDIHRS